MMNQTNRKQLLLLICMIVSVCFLFAGCGTAKSESITTGNQDQFLKDMAKGIKNRLDKSDIDTSAMTQEELMIHYEELVGYELEQISKYEHQTFEDEKFDVLAHLYISACTMQLEATQNYKNEELYTALWDGGRIARNGLIITLYDRYDLPITAEEADKYRTTPEVEYSISGDTDFLDIFGKEEDDVVLSLGDLMVVNSEMTFVEGYSPEYDSYEYTFTVLNNSAYTLESISIECAITDLDGNILGTEPLWIHNTVGVGKTAALSGFVYLTDYELPFYIIPDGFMYDGNGDAFVYELDVDPNNAEQYKIKIEATGYSSSNYDPSDGYICIECGNPAHSSYTNPFSGELEYYCETHYQEILDIIGMMESDVGNSSQSEHTCEECSKEGVHVYKSFTGQTEYYCTEHYEELMDMLESLGIG